MIAYRICVEQDLEDIHEQHFQAMLEANCLLEGPDLPADLADMQEHYADRQGIFAVAVSGAEIVGMGGLCISEPMTYEVRHLFVQRAYRGRQIGFGLLEFLMDSGLVSDEHRVCAHTLECMHAAQGLLRRHGFKAIAKYKRGSDECAYYLK